MDIKFSNFKGFKGEHQAEVSPLTIVCGENSAGKSTLLQLLRFAYSKHPSVPLGTIHGVNDGQVVPGAEEDSRLLVNTEGIGLRGLAPEHKTSDSIRIEAHGHSTDPYNWVGEEMIFSSVDGVAVEWKWKGSTDKHPLNFGKDDWVPSIIEFISLDYGKLTGTAKAIVPSSGKKNPVDPFPDSDTFFECYHRHLDASAEWIDTFYVHEFDALELYDFFSFCLTKPNVTTFDIFGKKAYGDEPLEELFPESPWCHEANHASHPQIADYNSWDRICRDHSLRNWKDKLGWADLTDDDVIFVGPISNPDAKEVLEIVEPILKNKKTRIVLSPSGWHVFGDFALWEGIVLEILLEGYINSFAISSVASKSFDATRGIWDTASYFLWEEHGAERFGFEIPSLRPPIPPSVSAAEPVEFGGEYSLFVSSSPESYINWIVRNEKTGHGKWFRTPVSIARKDITKTKAIEEINKAFEKIGIPHSLMISKRDIEIESTSTRQTLEKDGSTTERIEAMRYDENGYVQYHSYEASGGKELRIRFKDSRNGTVTTPRNVGSGVSQLLPIVAACELSKDNEPIVIEQPELHLHPKMQANVGEYLLDVAIRRGMDDFCPIIVETHSELFILRVLKMIKEGKANHGHVAVNYVSNTPDGPSITQLRIGPDGEFIDEWPAGFFEEQSDELF